MKQDKYRNRFIMRNASVLIVSFVIIFLSWFGGQLATKCLVEPYLRAVIHDTYTLSNQRTYRLESETKPIIVYDKEEFVLKNKDIDFISFAVSGFCVFVGIVISLVMSFYKSNNIDTILYQADDIERKMLFAEAKRFDAEHPDWKKL